MMANAVEPRMGNELGEKGKCAMRWSLAVRALIAFGLAIPFAAQAQTAIPANHGALSPAEIQRLSQNANDRVIVVFRDQLRGLGGHSMLIAREGALAREQAPILAELGQVSASHVQAYHLINAISATVSQPEAARLRSVPQVEAVVPDDAIRLGAQAPAQRPVGRSPTVAPCSGAVSLEPEALGLTNTAFGDVRVPQARNLATGKGVTVAFLAGGGLDVNNPDFIRPDGSHVFVDYQDFSGDGPNAAINSHGAETYADASSIAAQGKVTYNLNDFLNAAHKPWPCPQIKILGMAPGASLMDLKVFDHFGNTYSSNFVQAIQYAADHNANVINESYDTNPYPDNANDPITLANKAAVADGVSVVVSSGDAGPASTLGAPATDPGVIAAGATTQLRSYVQSFYAGAQLGSGGYLSNNIASFSSAGIAQSGKKTVDVVAPGDLGWAVFAGPSLQLFGGTSESAPLTAGEAALVIEAYRRAHAGVSPTPALVKQIIKSTATDLGVPSGEQGAGLINSLKAVQAALSLGRPARQGDTLLATPDILSATGAPRTAQVFPIQITNNGAQAETVRPSVRTLGQPFAHASYAATLDPQMATTFVDDSGKTRAYIRQTFTVPANTQRLDAAIAYPIANQMTSSPVRLTLFDPRGNLAAFSFPQTGDAPQFPNSGYGHVEVRFPSGGTWTAVIWTLAGAGGYRGPVHLDVADSRFVSAGTVLPAALTLQPGQTGRFIVNTRIPAQPGDFNADVQLDERSLRGQTSSAGAIPIVLRALVPLGANGGAFSGVLTGGNGRLIAPGQTVTYQFDVPGGKRDLDLGLSYNEKNPGYNLEGVLVDPHGLPVETQSTLTSLDSNYQLNGYASTMQFFRRDPEAGRWTLVLFINDNSSGNQTALPFTANITFNAVNVQASGLPNDPNSRLPAGTPVNVTVTVKNTGNTTKSFFVDPRLSSYAPLSLGSTNAQLPPSPQTVPMFFVPPETSTLSILAESMKPTVPITMDITNIDGAGRPFGGLNSPDIMAYTFIDGLTANYAAVASFSSPEVPFGLWMANPTEIGPYPDGGAPASTVQVGGVAVTQQFDKAVTSSTGDPYAFYTGQASGSYHLLTLAPGATGTITVTITPNAAAGTAVRGYLYVDTLALLAGAIPTTFQDDELVAIPYSYKVS